MHIEGIQRCWRKYGVLPLMWEADINNDIGRRDYRVGKEELNNEDTAKLYKLFRKLENITKSKNQDTMDDIEAFEESLLIDEYCSNKELSNIVDHISIYLLPVV